MNNPWYVWVMLGALVIFIVCALWMKNMGYTIG